MGKIFNVLKAHQISLGNLRVRLIRARGSY